MVHEEDVKRGVDACLVWRLLKWQLPQDVVPEAVTSLRQ